MQPLISNAFVSLPTQLKRAAQGPVQGAAGALRLVSFPENLLHMLRTEPLPFIGSALWFYRRGHLDEACGKQNPNQVLLGSVCLQRSWGMCARAHVRACVRACVRVSSLLGLKQLWSVGGRRHTDYTAARYKAHGEPEGPGNAVSLLCLTGPLLPSADNASH